MLIVVPAAGTEALLVKSLCVCSLIPNCVDLQVVKATWNNGSPSAEFNNAAQAWNHEFFWSSMKPGGGGKLSALSQTLLNISTPLA